MSNQDINSDPNEWGASVIIEKVNLLLDHQGSAIIDEEILGENIFISIDHAKVKTCKPFYVGNGITVVKEEGMEDTAVTFYYCKIKSNLPAGVAIGYSQKYYENKKED